MTPELLLPAGNAEKLKCAFHFGADAVYIGGARLSLRAAADNFDDEELKQSVAYAHSLNKKVYTAVNIFAKDSDIPTAAKYFEFLAEIGVDAAIISDTGLIALCKQVAPSLPIHLSTQANTLNSRAVRFWKDLGVERVVLGRELSLAEIAYIHEQVPDIELETFVHGAMCVSYSGRCLLSSYFAGRSANRGECAQPCRWNYRLTDIKQQDKPLFAEEDERGTYFMNSCDLNLIARLPELISAGVSSLKVEGRMKSEYYIATVAKTYRRALDDIARVGHVRNLSSLNEALDTISHRPYTEAFFDGASANTISNEIPKIVERAKFIATVTSSDGASADVEMRNRFKIGEELTALSVNSSLDGKSFTVKDICLLPDGKPVDDAKLVQRHYRIACPYALEQGDLLIRY